jgi:hypothetical protein
MDANTNNAQQPETQHGGYFCAKCGDECRELDVNDDGWCEDCADDRS